MGVKLRLSRVVALNVLLIAGLTALAATPAATFHPSGIEILPPSPDPATTHFNQLSPPLATALDDAHQLAEKYPTAFGYPYLDLAAGTIVLSTASANGSQLALQWTPRPVAAGVPRRTQSVTRTFASLERIRHDAIGPGVAGLPDGSAIWMTTRDEDHNRVILVLDHMSDPLLFALGARYGTQAIAVRIETNPGFHNISRSADTSPFWGGAFINLPSANYSCSSGF